MIHPGDTVCVLGDFVVCDPSTSSATIRIGYGLHLDPSDAYSTNYATKRGGGGAFGLSAYPTDDTDPEAHGRIRTIDGTISATSIVEVSW